MYCYSEQLPASGHLYTEPLGLGMNYHGLTDVNSNSEISRLGGFIVS